MTKQSADIKVKKEAAQKQKIYIDNESEKVKAEAAICDQIAAEAQAQLDLATPALEEAQRSVAGLDKKAINEIKAYNNPPKEVAKVMGAVMTYLKEGTTWTDIRKVMNDPKFINRIIDFDMDPATWPKSLKWQVSSAVGSVLSKNTTKLCRLSFLSVKSSNKPKKTWRRRKQDSKN
jgi:hypothetical protein